MAQATGEELARAPLQICWPPNLNSQPLVHLAISSLALFFKNSVSVLFPLDSKCWLSPTSVLQNASAAEEDIVSTSSGERVPAPGRDPPTPKCPGRQPLLHTGADRKHLPALGTEMPTPDRASWCLFIHLLTVSWVPGSYKSSFTVVSNVLFETIFFHARNRSQLKLKGKHYYRNTG